jgi:hypothetical protein
VQCRHGVPATSFTPGAGHNPLDLAQFRGHERPSNAHMRSKPFPLICLVLGMLFQAAIAAAVSPIDLGCSGDPIAVEVVAAATPCCNDHSSNAHGALGAADHTCPAAGTGSAPEHMASCSTFCSGDCAGVATPVVLVDPVAAPVVVVAAAVHLRLRVSWPASPAPHRLERPPQDNQS